MMQRWLFSIFLLLSSSSFAMEIEPLLPNSLEAQIKLLIDREPFKDKAYEQLAVIAQENEKTVADLHDLFEYCWEQKHDYSGLDYLTKKLSYDVLGLIVKQLVISDDSQNFTIREKFRVVRNCTLVSKTMNGAIPYLFICHIKQAKYPTEKEREIWAWDAIRVNAVCWIEKWLESKPSVKNLTTGRGEKYGNYNILMLAIGRARPKITQLLKNYVLNSRLDSQNGSLTESDFTSNADLFNELIALFEGKRATLDEILMKQVIDNIGGGLLIEYLYKTWNFQWMPSFFCVLNTLREQSFNWLKSKGIFKSIDSNFLLEVLKNKEQITESNDAKLCDSDKDLKRLFSFFVNDIDFSSIYLYCIDHILLSDQELQSVSPKSQQWYIDLMLFLMPEDRGEKYIISRPTKSLYVAELYTLKNNDMPEFYKIQARKTLQKWKDKLEKQKNEELKILSRMNNLTIKKQL